MILSHVIPGRSFVQGESQPWVWYEIANIICMQLSIDAIVLEKFPT